MSSRSWRVRTFVAGVIVTLTASLTPGFTAVAEPESAAFPVPQKDRPVHGNPAPVLPLPQDNAKLIEPGTPVAWPAGGVAEVTIGAGGARRQAISPPVRAGNLPVSVGVPAAQTAAAAAPVQKVHVEVADRQHSGPDQLVVRVRRTDGQEAPAPVNLDVDYSTFRTAFGGDWASRLQLTRAGCAGCAPEVVESHNDSARSKISAPVTVSGQDSTFVLTAAASGSTGSYKATSLAPSASWDVAAQTGDWSWSYPFRAPTVPGGLVPSMAASYSSSAVDGRTASTNNQSSWLGEGWDLWSGYVERSYASCTDDAANGTPKTGDQCWKTENATLSIPGHAGQLVFDAGKNAWRPEKDDGSKIEHLFYGTPVNGDDNGEYWKITTADGVQYFFGSKADSQSTWTVPVYGNDVNEPCHQAAFENSVCQQGYRWNLDHVVDTHGNTVNYFYARETNNYGSNLGKTPRNYTRGGTLLRAEYGTHDGIAGAAPAQLVFDTAERCVPGSKCNIATAADFPDVPVDMKCDSGPCDTKVAPTFWTTKRLAKITSKVLDGGKLRDVEAWTFNQTFPDPGDRTSASLWLQGITHQGLSGTAISTPPITFTGIMLANRVDSAPDGLPAMNKYRLSSVATESGGTITANYKKAECVPGPKPAPEANGGRCYPVHWTPDKGQAIDDWFHKYVVETVVQVDNVGASPAQTTSYDYEGAAAWAYDDNPLIPAERRTWSRWRGYEKVLVRHGTPGSATEAATRFQYFRGMNGDHLPNGSRTVKIKDSQGVEVNDDAPLNGFVREQITYSGVKGTEVTGTISQPEVRGPTATQGSLKSYAVRTVKIASRTALAAGGFRRTETTTKYDDTDLPIEVHDAADITKPDDDQCTRTTYVRNPGAGIVGLPATQETVGLPCSGAATTADVLSRARTYYDGHALDGAPTRGEVTKTETAIDHAGADLRYASTRSTYDAYGRVVETVDPVEAKTITKYVPDTGMPTSSTVTNALGQATTVTNDVGWGVPLSSVDPNGRRTDLEYDALGRLVKVWSPGRSKEYKEEPNISYGYAVRNNGPSWISTKTLKPEGNYVTSYALFDGFFRSRQTQAPAWGGGRVLTDTVYDDRGLVSKTNAAYFNDTSGPGTDLLLAPDNQVASQKIETYDAAGRPTVSTFRKLNDAGTKTDDVTTTVNAGDHTDVLPPQGGTTTSAYSDARGNVLESRQYQGRQPTGPADVTKYAYTKGGDLASVTDPAGNTWRFEYDLAHRMVKSTDPDKGVATMVYDDAGRMTSTTDSRGATIATVFDKLGRKTESHQDSATGPKLADWTYDTILKGLPTSSASYRGGNTYTSSVIDYDEANRPTGTRTVIPAAEGKLAGTYDSHVTYRADGSPSTMAMPAAGDLAAETLFIDYDSLGLARGLGAGVTRYVDNAAYTVFSEPIQLKLGNSGKQVAQTSFLDTATRRVTQVKTDKQGTGESHVDDRQYTYDPAGNITKIADTVGNRDTDIQCFDYDHVQRLTEAWTANDGCATPPQPSKISGVSPYWNSYRYDAAGNRTEETQHAAAPVGGDTTRKYTYPAAGQPHPHAVQAVDTTSPGGTQRDTYDYDSAGNTKTRNIAGVAKTLNWNPQGRLESDADGDKKNDYVYDADGTRLIRHDDTGATLYLGNQEVRFDKATNACSTTRYYSHNGQAVASRTKAGVTWLLSDHHGTNDVSVNANTLLVSVRRSMPFGEQRGPKPTGWPGEKGFVGGTTDPTGLTHLGAREYDPSLGRFLSVDPVIDPSDPQQINPYTYANSSPVTSSDPSGLYVVGGVDDLGRPWGVSYPATKGHDADLVGIWPKHNSGAELINRKQAAQQRQYWNRQTAHAQHLKDRGIDEAEVQRARDMANKKLIDVVIEAGGEILKDFLGITDIEECFGDGNVGSCISMVINAIPVGKVLRIGEYIGAVKRAFKGVMDFLEKLPGARSLLSKADDAENEFNAISSEAKAVEDVGESCAFNSFTPDTPVLMADGTRRPIEDVKVGDQVATTDPDSGRTAPHLVARTIIGTGQKDLVQLTIDSGDERAPQVTTVTATANHPFWVPSHQEWMDAADLLPGDVLLTSTGTWVHVTAIKHWTALQRVHNLTVDTVHTYYAAPGSTSLLTHNCGTSFGPVAREAHETADHIAKNGAPPRGYKGGRSFENDGRQNSQILPGKTDDGKPVSYREWDVRPKVKGVDRGADRLVSGSDGKWYYTTDHYRSFTQFR